MMGDGIRGALIMGGSSGIGAAAAKALAAMGIPVAICARNQRKLNATRDEIVRAGGTAHVHATDLCAPGAAADIITWGKDVLGMIDMVLFTAGIVRLSDVACTKRSSWEKHLSLNLLAAAEAAEAVLPFMRKEKYGWFLAIGSAVALHAVPGTGAYGVSKKGLEHLIRLIALENRQYGIRSCLIALGWVHTDLAADPESLGVCAEKLLKPEDIANVVKWLISQPSHVLIGPVIEIQAIDPQADAVNGVESFIKSLS